MSKKSCIQTIIDEVFEAMDGAFSPFEIIIFMNQKCFELCMSESEKARSPLIKEFYKTQHIMGFPARQFIAPEINRDSQVGYQVYALNM